MDHLAEQLLVLVDLCNLGQETSQDTVEGMWVLKMNLSIPSFPCTVPMLHL